MKVNLGPRYMNVNIPDDWTVKSIDECCSILDSKRVPLNFLDRDLAPGEIPYYGANGVQGYINKHIFDEELILLAEDGGNFNQFQTRPIAYKISGKSWVNNHAHVLKNKKGYDLNFIFYSLIHKNITPFVQGTTRGKLNQQELKKIKIPFPKDQREAQKIASMLSNIDELIQKQKRVIEQTQKLMKGQMQKLLTKGINHTKLTNRPWLFGKKIEIPVEWELKRIKDLTEVSVGLVINPSTYFDDNGTVPMITGKNVTENGIVLDKVDFISEKSNKLLDKTRIWSGDLVTMRVGYPGRTSLVKDEHDGINCASVIITRKSKKIDSQFLYYLANSELISKQVTKYEAGSAQKVINIDSWENFLIPFPPLPEQQKIASILSNLDLLTQQEKQYKEKLEKIKRGLMQQLLTGQTRVKV